MQSCSRYILILVYVHNSVPSLLTKIMKLVFIILLICLCMFVLDAL